MPDAFPCFESCNASIRRPCITAPKGGFEMKFGIYLDGELIELYDDDQEVYDAAKQATKETGIFHEVRTVKHPNLELYGKTLSKEKKISLYLEEGERDTLDFFEKSGKYYVRRYGYSGYYEKEISKSFYEAAFKEAENNSVEWVWVPYTN